MTADILELNGFLVYAERRAYQAGVQFERNRLYLEMEKQEEHIKHLEDRLADAYAKQGGVDNA